MKKHVQIKDSYKIWRPCAMSYLIVGALIRRYTPWGWKADYKGFKLLFIEWWLHNIGYWITKPFIFIPAIKRLNLRFRDVDLMVPVEEAKDEDPGD